MAGKRNDLRLMRADRDDDIIILGLELLDLLLGHAHAKIDMNQLLLEETLHLHLPDRLGQPLPRDGLGQLAAELIALFKNVGLNSSQSSAAASRRLPRSCFRGSAAAGLWSGCKAI